MKRRLVVAAALGVALIVAVVLAYTLWHCGICGWEGRAHYTCPTHGWFATPAYDPEGGNPGPPDHICPKCSTMCPADSAVCSGPLRHRYYPPSWSGY